MTAPDTNTTDTEAPVRSLLTHPALMWTAVGGALIVVGWFADRLGIGDSEAATPLLVVGGLAVMAVAGVYAWTHPGHSSMAAWLLPRVALALVAGAIGLGTPGDAQPEPLPTPSSPQSPALVCPRESNHEDYRELLHARLRGNTLACIYEYIGGQL